MHDEPIGGGVLRGNRQSMNAVLVDLRDASVARNIETRTQPLESRRQSLIGAPTGGVAATNMSTACLTNAARESCESPRSGTGAHPRGVGFGDLPHLGNDVSEQPQRLVGLIASHASVKEAARDADVGTPRGETALRAAAALAGEFRCPLVRQRRRPPQRRLLPPEVLWRRLRRIDSPWFSQNGRRSFRNAAPRCGSSSTRT